MLTFCNIFLLFQQKYFLTSIKSNMAIINLTRTSIPQKVSTVAKHNIEAMLSMPEMVLFEKIVHGDKSIVKCVMNKAVAEEISSKGVTTIYTDGLAGCNSINVITKLNNNRFLSVMSHYTPISIKEQISTIAKLLKENLDRMNKNYEPRVFLNLRGVDRGNGLEVAPNRVIGKLQEMLDKFFPQGVKMDITPYKYFGRPAFFSSANIFQFDPKKISSLKITNVGEQEKFVNLNI